MVRASLFSRFTASSFLGAVALTKFVHHRFFLVPRTRTLRTSSITLIGGGVCREISVANATLNKVTGGQSFLPAPQTCGDGIRFVQAHRPYFLSLLSLALH